MPSTDIDGSAILILSADETLYIKAYLPVWGMLGPKIIKKCDEVIAFETDRNRKVNDEKSTTRVGNRR